MRHWLLLQVFSKLFYSGGYGAFPVVIVAAKGTRLLNPSRSHKCHNNSSQIIIFFPILLLAWSSSTFI